MGDSGRRTADGRSFTREHVWPVGLFTFEAGKMLVRDTTHRLSSLSTRPTAWLADAWECFARRAVSPISLSVLTMNAT